MLILGNGLYFLNYNSLQLAAAVLNVSKLISSNYALFVLFMRFKKALSAADIEITKFPVTLP